MNLDRNTLAGLLAPAAVGALGGGALAAHLSNRVKRPHESPQEHRRRVLRNALMGVALGGTAGAVIPGARLAGSTFANAKPGLLSRTADAGIGGLAHNFAGIGVGTLGGLAIHRNHAKARGRARQLVADMLFEHDTPQLESRLSKLESALSNPTDLENAIGALKSRKAGAGLLLSGHEEKALDAHLGELMDAAGHKHQFKSWLGNQGLAPEIEARHARTALKEHLGGQGVLSKLLAGKIKPEGGEGLLESGRLAQQFKKLTGPGAWKSVRRISPAVGAAAIVPAALMANRAQHQLMGE